MWANFSPIESAFRCSIATTATPCRWSRTTSWPRLLLRYDPRSQSARRDSGADHRALFERCRKPELPRFSFVRHFIFPDPRSRNCAVMPGRPARSRRRLRHERGPGTAGSESGAAGRRHHDRGGRTRDRSKWKLRRSALRKDRVHQSHHGPSFRRRYRRPPHSTRRQATDS